MTSHCAGTVQMRGESDYGIKAKIHYTSFLLQVCNKLVTSPSSYGETCVMDFGHKQARRGG